ncbi:LysR family transcriptional regulator [Sphingomonadaceae bacterium OTU29LAMAA1]|nr:LysR family transcriptional regulator [Sphingomonadaceae bacterium OTU29LAMAA1]
MFDWNDVRYFIAVAQTGSTLAAARQLGVSQTTAARRIAALEKALGVPLFDRVPTGYRLTEQGRTLLPRALEVEREATSLGEAAAAGTRLITGTVRLTIGEIYASTVLAPMLGDFHEAYPGIRLQLETTDALRDLAGGAADVALRSCVRPEGAGLVGRRVASDDWGIYCSIGYAERRGMPAGRRDLVDHVLIGGGEPGVRKYYREWLERHGLADQVAVDHDSSVGMLSAVRAGLGIAALPCLVADMYPDLTRCLPPMPEGERGLWLLAHERLRHDPRVRATLDFLAERFGRLPHGTADRDGSTASGVSGDSERTIQLAALAVDPDGGAN